MALCYLWVHRWWYKEIMYLSCATNSTVLPLFCEPVSRHSLSQRVRADQGIENVDVARYMFSHPTCASVRGSFISGRSVHNQQIERFWRDLYLGCAYIYYSIFHYLKEQEYLNPVNEIHLYCLHYVFLPRINHHIQQFADGWDNHPIRTERNATPNQLWILRLHMQCSNTDTFGLDANCHQVTPLKLV